MCPSALYQLVLCVLQAQVSPLCPGGAEVGQGKPLHTHRVSSGAGRDTPCGCTWFPSAGGCWENEKQAVGWQSQPEQLKERRGKDQEMHSSVCGFSGT